MKNTAESAKLKLQAAETAAEKILKAYPDYAKAPPEYLLTVVEVLATFDAAMQAALANPTTGVASRCRFLPTIADIVEIAKEFAEKKYLRDRDLGRPRRSAEPKHYSAPCPFPKLYDAFFDERELLNANFDILSGASRALATYGKDAARRILATESTPQSRGLKVAPELSPDELREKFKREAIRAAAEKL